MAAAPGDFPHNVAPILHRSCAPCHHPGGPAPFSLLTYKDAAKHAAQVAAVTRFGRRFGAGICTYAVIRPPKICRECSTRWFEGGSSITGVSPVYAQPVDAATGSIFGPLGLPEIQEAAWTFARETRWIARISRRDSKLWPHWQMGTRQGSIAGAALLRSGQIEEALANYRQVPESLPEDRSAREGVAAGAQQMEERGNSLVHP